MNVINVDGRGFSMKERGVSSVWDENERERGAGRIGEGERRKRTKRWCRKDKRGRTKKKNEKNRLRKENERSQSFGIHFPTGRGR